MRQNEKYDAIIVGICHDAAVLAEMWEVVRTLFVDYAEDVIASLTPIAEAINLSQEAVESQIMTVEDVSQLLNTPLKKMRCKGSQTASEGANALQLYSQSSPKSTLSATCILRRGVM